LLVPAVPQTAHGVDIRRKKKRLMSRLTLRNALGAIAVLLVCVFVAVFAVMDRNTTLENSGPALSRPGIRYTIESPVYLYFQDANQEFLSVEERVIAHPETAVDFARTIMEWLIKGPQKGLVRTIPAETTLRAIYVDDGTAYVDFSRDIHDNHPGGVKTEYLTILSITNSLILNIPDIRRVKILVEGHEEETLAGHIDISQPFAANMLVVR
jgi:spore germination protein GerM